MEELKQKYAQEVALYENAIEEGQTPEQITKLNLEISKTLEEMIGVLTQVKRDESGNIEVYRKQLIEKLQTIQKEYNGLVRSTDKLETLRRIRQDQKDPSVVRRYLYFFFAVAFFVLVMLFVFSQKKPTAAAIPSSPAIATTFR